MDERIISAAVRCVCGGGGGGMERGFLELRDSWLFGVSSLQFFYREIVCPQESFKLSKIILVSKSGPVPILSVDSDYLIQSGKGYISQALIRNHVGLQLTLKCVDIHLSMYILYNRGSQERVTLLPPIV